MKTLLLTKCDIISKFNFLARNRLTICNKCRYNNEEKI